MKKISLLAIASFVSVLAFSQSAKTQVSTNKTGKYLNTTATTASQAQIATSSFTNAAGVGAQSAVAVPAQKVAATKTKAVTGTTKVKKTATN